MCEGGKQRAVLWEAAVDGSLDFLRMQPEGQQCCVSQAFSTIIAIRAETDEMLQLHKSCCSSLGSCLFLFLCLSLSVSLAHSSAVIIEL